MVTSYNFALASYQFLKGATVIDSFYLPDSFLVSPAGGDVTGVVISEDNGAHTRFLSNVELSNMGFASVALFTVQFDADKLSVIPANAANPSGAANYIQYSDGANFASSINLQWDDTAKTLTLGNATNSMFVRAIGGNATEPNVVIGKTTSGAALTTGYANVVLGNDAGVALTDGDKNVLVGKNAGQSLTTTNSNVVIGYDAAADPAAGTRSIVIGSSAAREAISLGSSNIALGSGAGYANLDGSSNIAIGTYAGRTITSTAERNTVMGDNAVNYALTSDDNVVIGTKAAEYGLSGHRNVILGRKASYGYDGGTHSTTGSDNVVIGTQAARYGMTGSSNVVIGHNAVGYEEDIFTGSWNTILGGKAGYNMRSSANKNIVIGYEAGYGVSGARNILMGDHAGFAVSGSNNIALGTFAMGDDLMSGSHNMAFGVNAGLNLTGASTNNIFIGQNAGYYETTAVSNQLYIHSSDTQTTTPLIHGDFSTGILTIGSVLVIPPITAAAASALTAVEGMVLNVSDTDATFTSTGIWIYQGAAWSKNTLT